MFIIRNFLLNSKNKDKSAYVWNTLSALFNSFQTVIILMVISRIDPINDAGTFVIAYAVANLLVMIGRYGIRQFQASDIEEQFSFSEYFILRIITSVVMIILGCGYIFYMYHFGSYSSSKAAVVLLICGLRTLDAFEDVIHGMFQQHARLDICGKILSIRYITFISEYIIIYFRSHNLILTSAVCLITNMLLCLYMNTTILKDFNHKKISPKAVNIKKLSIDCFPIFVSTFLMTYMGNAPKYAIDVALTSQEQAQFNYIFMPVFIISLMSTFIYQPMINRLSIIWAKHNMKHFWGLIAKQCVLISIMTLVVLAGGWLLGLPVLSIVYGVNLMTFKTEFMLLLLGGGCLAFVNFFTMIITITRFQKYLIVGYAFISLLFFILGKDVAVKYNIIGISAFYTLLMLLLAIIFFVYIIIIAKKSNKHHN